MRRMRRRRSSIGEYKSLIMTAERCRTIGHLQRHHDSSPVVIFSAMQIEGPSNIRHIVLAALPCRTFSFALLPKMDEMKLITPALAARFQYTSPEVLSRSAHSGLA
jgi:dolichol kinase